VSRPPSSVLDCAIPPSTPAPLPSLHSCMAALHAAESRASAALRFGMLRFPCPCRPPCPGRSHNSLSTSGRGRARLYAAWPFPRRPWSLPARSTSVRRPVARRFESFVRSLLPAKEGPATRRLRQVGAGRTLTIPHSTWDSHSAGTGSKMD
jgi:hypothetical protein